MKIVSTKSGSGHLLEIDDNGVGISKEEIQFLITMATSNKNTKRKRLVNKMPEWMKPSGFFGIGFHSIFQDINEVVIYSKSIHDLFQYEIRFSEKGKQVKIKKIDNEYVTTKSFTRIIIELDSEKIPDRVTYSFENNMALETISNFDPLIDDKLPIQKVNLMYFVAKYSLEYQIPIFLNGDRINKNYEQYGGRFIPESNCNLIIQPMINKRPGSNISYRNQIVLNNTREFRYKYLAFDLDILHGNADDYLSFSREKLTGKGKDKISNLLDMEIPRILESFYNNYSDKKDIVSLAYHTNFPEGNHKIGDEWKDIEISQINNSENKKKIREILNQKEITAIYENKRSSTKNLIVSFLKDNYIIDSRLDILDYFKSQLFKEFPYYQLTEFSDKTEHTIIGGEFPMQDLILKMEYKFSKDEFMDDKIISKSAIKYFFGNYVTRISSNPNVKRTLLPLFNKKYNKISIDYHAATTDLPFVQSIYFFDKNLYKKCIINPFIPDDGKWIVKGLDEAKKKTFEINSNIVNSVNFNEISGLFDELLQELKGILEDETGEEKE